MSSWCHQKSSVHSLLLERQRTSQKNCKRIWFFMPSSFQNHKRSLQSCDSTLGQWIPQTPSTAAEMEDLVKIFTIIMGFLNVLGQWNIFTHMTAFFYRHGNQLNPPCWCFMITSSEYRDRKHLGQILQFWEDVSVIFILSLTWSFTLSEAVRTKEGSGLMSKK